MTGTITYMLLPWTFNGITYVKRMEEGVPGYVVIPSDPTNNDYIAYLAWLAEGNEPLPYDGSR